jgi:very-short-patch-repair endonuclease
MSRTAKHYGVGFHTVRAELVRQGIPIKPRGHVKGQKKSQAWREASARNWNNPEWRARQRVRWLERLPTMNGPQANSPLEKLLHRALRKAGISFSTQRRMLDRYVVDILITQRPVVIEADGNMHLHAHSRVRDAVRDADLRQAGYEVFRFTGKPICNDPDGCIRQVIEACSLTPDNEPVYDVRNGMVGPDSPSWKGGKQEWVCQNPACGKTFLAWKRGYGRTPQCCSRECQVAWQKVSKASVANRSSNGDRMRELWADPEWRARQLRRQQEGRREAASSQ